MRPAQKGPLAGSVVNMDFKLARPNEAKLQEIFDEVGCDWEDLAQSLLSWLSDDEVGRFAETYGWFDEV